MTAVSLWMERATRDTAGVTRTAHSAPSQEARERAFAAAQRHTRLVKGLRRLIAAGVPLALLGVVVVKVYLQFGAVLRDVTFESIGIEGGRVTMDKPHLKGERRDGARYDITAVKASQDAKQSGAVDLALLGGVIALPNGDEDHVFAQTGRYDRTGETMTLQGDVRLDNAKYEVRLEDVAIEFQKGNYSSQNPVAVRILPDTTINADSFFAHDGGEVVHFEGHVVTVIQPPPSATAEANK